MSQAYPSVSADGPPNRHGLTSITSFHYSFVNRPQAEPIPLRPLPQLPTYQQETNSPHNGPLRPNRVQAPPNSTPLNNMPSSQAQPTHTQIPPSGSESETENPESSRSPWLEKVVINFFVEWWMLEILSWCFSAVCMAAIVGVLVYYDGRSIPNWPLGITINSFISVFSGFAKSALLLPTAEALGQIKWNSFSQYPRPMMDFERIDMASRGPWGAFLLLARTKGRTLSSIGAAIVLLALPLDLFFQQIVAYPSGWVNAGNGTIPRALTYIPPDGVFYTNGTKNISPSREMIAFAEPEFLGNGTVPGLKASCPTSNCTWEPFHTLAVCSQCMEMTQDIHWGCNTAPADWLSNVTISDDSYPNVTTCGYYLHLDSDLAILMSGYVLDERGKPGEALSTRIVPLTDPDPLSRKPIAGGSINFKDVRNPISNFIVAGTPDGTFGVYANKTPTVEECVLHWCVKMVESAYYWGRQLENTTYVMELDTQDDNPWFFFNSSDGIGQANYLAEFSLTIPPGNQPELQNNSFSVSNLSTLQTIYLFDEIAPAYVTAFNESEDPQLRWLNGGQFFYSLPQVLSLSAITNPWLPPNNVTEHVEKLATAMTTVIRNTVDNTNSLQLVTGIAWDQRTFVKIRWLWMIFPLALLVVSLIFLMATVIRSSNEEPQVGIWKTSIIAVLFNGLGEEVQKTVRPNFRMGEAKNKARKTRVMLVPE